MLLKIIFFPIKLFLYFIILMSLSQIIEIQGKSLNSHFTQAFTSIKKWAYKQNILEHDSLTLKISSPKNRITDDIPKKDKEQLNQILKKHY